MPGQAAPLPHPAAPQQNRGRTGARHIRGRAKLGTMTMREDCRHFQSRTYTTGEVARFCVLNLAPEAPWRCPSNCPRYQKDVIDGSFVVGSLARPQVEQEPDMPEGEVASVLDAADLIVTAAGPEILKEIERKRESKPWWKVWRRKEDGGLGLSAR